jgi:hypothetical protein
LTAASRWYNASSAWNTPIPSSPAIHPLSAQFVSTMQNLYCGGNGCVAPTDYYGTPSVWIADNSTPLATVQVNFPSGCNSSRVQIPIPPGAQPSSSGDPEPVMTVLNKDTGDEWDFYKVTMPGATPVNAYGVQCPANGLWQAIIAQKNQGGWLGQGNEQYATRASGTYLGAGLLRPRDWQMPAGSTWDHALAYAYNGDTSQSVWPATHSDGQCTKGGSCVPMGARFQLDPSINCSTWPSITSEFMRQMCRTLQKYGMIVIDSGNGIVTENVASAHSTSPYADSPHNGVAAPWWSGAQQYLPQDLYPHLRVIDWNAWTG